MEARLMFPRPPSSGMKSGADRARTDDLLHAMQALSQLSYGPNSLGNRRCPAEELIGQSARQLA